MALTAGAGTRRHVRILDLVDDEAAIAAYRAWHRPGGPPPAVVRAIRESGIVSMEIWQVADRLVMVMETTADYDAAQAARNDAANSDVRAWEALMDRFQRRLLFAIDGEKWVGTTRIFDLTAQP